jgi:hypothetical protein
MSYDHQPTMCLKAASLHRAWIIYHIIKNKKKKKISQFKNAFTLSKYGERGRGEDRLL